MMKNRFLFVAMLFAALSLGFVSCDNKGNEPDDPQGEQTEQGGSTENNGGEETPTPEEPVTFTLTVLSSDAEKGEVTGSGVYNEGAEGTITATPKPHYMFVEWSDGNTDNPRTIIVNKDVTYTAVFAGAKGSENGYEWVDLGLSVKWATCNVGATKPEEYGNYYAWGEVEPKEVYNWETYKWYDTESNEYTKYCTSEIYGTVDNKTVLDKEDDTAAVNMGGSWRMPTYDEIEELKTECTWTRTENYATKGAVGYIVTSKTNGNSIFLPVAGSRFESDLDHAGSYGYYWSSSLDWWGAFYLQFSNYLDCGESRIGGLSVRGVIE